MKLAISVLLLLLTEVFLNEQFGKYGEVISEDPFGTTEELMYSVDSEISYTQVSFPENNNALREKRWKNIFNSMTSVTSQQLNDAKTECGGPSALNFVAAKVAIFGRENDPESVSIQSPCFQDTKISFVILDEATIQITIQAYSATSLTCSDFYMLSTGANFHLKNVFFRGTHYLTYTKISSEEMQSVKHYGFHVYRFCSSVINILPEALMTIMMFKEVNIPYVSSKLYEDFITKAMNIQFIPRENKILDIKNEVISGDVIIEYAFNGLNQVTHYSSGGNAGHAAVCLWIDGELYVLESTGKGITRTTWAQWTSTNFEEGSIVALFKLTDEYRKKFNANKLLDYFKTIEGLDYGYRNFFYSIIDTLAGNYPPPLDPDFIPTLLEISDIYKSSTDLYREALNFRLGTKDLTFIQITEELYNRKMTFLEALAIPEDDRWVYKTGVNRVCSALATDLLKAAGVFDGLEINAAEFTPKDVYMLKIFEDDPLKRPQACIESDPDLKYCQIMGKYKYVLKEFNTIPIYSHMNEKCPSMPPLYERPEGC